MAEQGLTNLVAQVRKYLELARRVARRWWIIAIFTAIGVGGSVAVALNSTRIYQSRALVAWKMNINWQSLGHDQSNRPHSNRLKHQVNQLTASNTLLIKIARELNLYPKEREELAPEVTLDTLRKSISFNTVGTDSFWIAFEYKDRALAQKATERLVEEFIRRNVRDKLASARGTQAFMEGEADKVKTQLDAIESKLATFIADHPEFQIYLTGFAAPSSTRERPVDSKRPSRRVRYIALKDSPELKDSLAEKGRLEAKLLALNPRSDGRMMQVQNELSRARRALANLRQRYSDQHPDVQRATEYLRRVQRQVQGASTIQRDRAAKTAAMQVRLKELDEQIARLSSRRKVKVSQPKKAGVKKPAKVAAKVAAKATDLPDQAQLEKQWYSLSGDRAVARAKYEQIQTQLQQSKLSAAAIRKQAEKEFRVVDPASYPGKPIRPSRRKMVAAGTGAGFMLGFGLAALLVLFDPRIYNTDDLKKVTDLPVLAQIPRVK